MNSIKSNIFSIITFISLFLAANYLIINNSKYILIQIAIVLVLVLIVFSFTSKISLQLFLIVISILPFAYIEKEFSRSFTIVLIQNIPLIVLFALFILEYIRNNKSFTIKIDYLFIPLFVYVLFSFWLVLLGIFSGNSKTIIMIEIYQVLYFLLVFPISYYLKNRKSYLTIFILLISVFVIVSIEYTILNILSPLRITTYHNHIFPIAISFSLAGMLFLKKKYFKIASSVLFLIIWTGSIATETRTLWVSNLVSMGVIFLLFLKYKNVKTKYIFATIALGFSLFILVLLSSGGSTGKMNNAETDEKVESISDPLAEVSFLMRVEATYLSYNEIIKKPILGYGFGYLLQMKYLLKTEYIFPDNNYLYYWLKGGVLYLLVVFWMFFRILKITYKLYIKSESDILKFSMSSLFAGIIGIMSFAFLNANLIKLRLNFIYAIMFAYINFEYKNYIQNKDMDEKKEE